MPNYKNGKIYSIRFYNSNHIYIGSTTQSLSARLGGHKNGNTKSVKHHIDNICDGNWNECYIELIENFECKNKEELNE